MNNRTKIVAGVVAGLVAGASLVGAAFATPQVSNGAVPAVYRMMGTASASTTAGIPTVAEMQSFMNRYRTSSGAIDMNRMHADVTSGKVTPPCANRGTQPSTGTGTGTAGGSGMMGRTY